MSGGERNPDRGAHAAALTQAIFWFTRMRSDVLMLADYVTFRKWLARDERHRRSFRRIQLLWRGAPSLDEMERCTVFERRQHSLVRLSDEWMKNICPAVWGVGSRGRRMQLARCRLAGSR